MITILITSFVFLTAVFTVATIFSPEFRENGAVITGVILGGYVSILGGAGIGAYLTKEIRASGNSTEGPGLSDKGDGEEK